MPVRRTQRGTPEAKSRGKSSAEDSRRKEIPPPPAINCLNSARRIFDDPTLCHHRAQAGGSSPGRYLPEEARASNPFQSSCPAMALRSSLGVAPVSSKNTKKRFLTLTMSVAAWSFGS